MDLSRLPEIKALFDAAFPLPQDQRETYVRQSAAGDDELAERVLRLLALSQSEETAEPDPAVPPLVPGQVLGSRYRILRFLKSGGFAMVYLAADERLGSRRVVLKILPGRSHGMFSLDTAQTELLALARLRHPSVVAIHDAGETESGHVYLVLEYVEGPTLRDELKRLGQLPTERALRIVSQVGAALTAGHRAGIWHLDVKPENIILRHNGDGTETAVLLDYGVAHLCLGVDLGPEPVLPAGSLPYLAPEQWDGSPTGKSDLYSLAVVANELLTGKRLRDPSQLSAFLPPDTRKALQEALRPDADARPGSVGDFLESLSRQRRRWHRRELMLASALLLSLFGAALWRWFHVQEEVGMIRKTAEKLSLQASEGLGPSPGSVEILDDAIRQYRRYTVFRMAVPERVLYALSTALVDKAQYLMQPGRRNLGKLREGEEALREALGWADKLFAEYPELETSWLVSINVRNLLGTALIEANRYREAEQVLDQGRHFAEGGQRKFPQSGSMQAATASSIAVSSRVPFHNGDFERCLRLRTESLELRRQVGIPDPQARLDLAGAYALRGYVLRSMGRYQDALNDYAEADRLLLGLTSDAVRLPHFQWHLARNRMEEGRIYLEMDKPQMALGPLTESCDTLRRVTSVNPFDAASRRQLALALSHLSLALAGTDRQKARAASNEAVRLALQAVASDPGNVKASEELALVRGNHSRLFE